MSLSRQDTDFAPSCITNCTNTLKVFYMPYASAEAINTYCSIDMLHTGITESVGLRALVKGKSRLNPQRKTNPREQRLSSKEQTYQELLNARH
jgi:hypothetical protein